MAYRLLGLRLALAGTFLIHLNRGELHASSNNYVTTNDLAVWQPQRASLEHCGAKLFSTTDLIAVKDSGVPRLSCWASDCQWIA